ncbi:MAG: glycosyltransferase family 2 protein [Nitrospirae bacterium]|nr:glycosyltransferase family 2 protein [Nitrospirota bacterium]
MPLISIIIPTYNEEQNLPILYQRLQNITENSKNDFEFVFIDDGSSDSSFNVLQELSFRDPRIKIIKFSRNFGSHAGCMAGLVYSKGDACAFISADLQDPPELLQQMIEEWKKGCEVVIGIREWEEESTRFLPKIYYKMVRRFALKNMPEGGTDVFLIDRSVVNTVKDMKEKNTSIFGLILWSGFKQALIRYKKGLRYKGTSKWTLAKKVKLFIDTFVSFSYFPIRLISFIGISLAFVGFIYAIVIIIKKLLFNIPIEGWASLMIVLLLVSGVQLLMLGVLGEYLWRNFDESRNRPVFIIDKMIGFEEDKKIIMKGGNYD